MAGRIAVLQALLSVTLLGAQQPAPPSPAGPGIPGAGPTGTPDKKLSADAEKLAAKVLDSYYHPDKLPGLACDVTPDWQSFFASAKLTVSPEHLQGIEALKVHVRAVRDETPELTFNWTQARPANASQIESVLRQMIGGFYQMYWSLFASPAIKYTAVISKIEPQPDGSTKVYESDPNAYVIMTVDKHGTPIHYSMQSPAMSGSVDPQYTPTPHPTHGDRRRITSVDAVQQTGTSSTHVQVSVDYQPLDNYFVPRQVTYGLVGAYSMTMEFTGCSVVAGSAPAN
jgi:hypothetical protein